MWNFKLSVNAQHCFCQHVQDQNQKPKCWSSRLSSPSLLLKLQTSSMCLNGRWRGFASATKRLATSMTDPGRVDRARQLLEMTACWSDCQKPGPMSTASTAPGGVDASDASFIKNCTSDSCLQWTPRSYCCLETSTKQETANKPCCVQQGPQPDERLDSIKVVKKGFFRWIVSWAPSQAPRLLTTLRGTWRSFWMPARQPSMPSPDDFINKFYNYLPNRIATVLQAKGTHTRYQILVHDELLVWFFICYFIYFLRKIKCIDYNLIDYYLW